MKVRRSSRDKKELSSSSSSSSRAYHSRSNLNIIQMALKVGASDDLYEKQADRVADQVVTGTRQEEILPVKEQATDDLCPECEEQLLQKKSKPGDAQSENFQAIQPVASIIRSGGQPLENSVRANMEQGFAESFQTVRIHTGSEAAASAETLGARAFTLGQHIVFGSGQYRPHSKSGQHLLAHELTHTLQQANNPASTQAVKRACLSATVCAGSRRGSAEQFSDDEEASELPHRRRRQRMTCARATDTSHAGRARQLEVFMRSQEPGFISRLHGIFIDMDLSSRTEATVGSCADWRTESLPTGCDPAGFATAAKPCAMVHGYLNQQAYQFNRGRTSIAGQSRESWRIATFQTLTHEVQHVIFDNSASAPPAGAAGCSRDSIVGELTELSAIMSEFSIVFRAVPTIAGPARTLALNRLNNWFTHSVTNPRESLSGALKAMRCTCDCAQVNAYVRDVFNRVASSWSVAERIAFNRELRNARWNVAPHNLNWPL